MSSNQSLKAEKDDTVKDISQLAKERNQIHVPAATEVIEQATGTKAPQLQQWLINQVNAALCLHEGLPEHEHRSRVQAAVSMLQGIGPKDEIEGMLAAQMVATHNAAMQCLEQAMAQEQTFEGREQSLKYATKLLSTFTRQMETLNKNREKGQQKVTVEHVNVEAGGQAIVGIVGAGVQPSTQNRRPEQPTKAIANDPGETIDMNMAIKEPAHLRNERDSEGGGKS